MHHESPVIKPIPGEWKCTGRVQFNKESHITARYADRRVGDQRVKGNTWDTEEGPQERPNLAFLGHRNIFLGTLKCFKMTALFSYDSIVRTLYILSS